jgi:hypothetical protein
MARSELGSASSVLTESMRVERALSSPTGGGDQTALTFRYTSRAQLAQWQTMLGAGVEVGLADPQNLNAPPTARSGLT